MVRNKEDDLYDYGTSEGTRAGAQVASAGLLAPEKWVGASGIGKMPEGMSESMPYMGGKYMEDYAESIKNQPDVFSDIGRSVLHPSAYERYGIKPVTESTAVRTNLEPTPEDRRFGYETERAPVAATTGIAPKKEGWREELEATSLSPITVGPERFFKDGKEAAAGIPGSVSGDELARKNVLRTAGGEPYIKPEIVAGGPGGAIATFRGGARSLADKEADEWGLGGKPEAPGEFDYTKFKEGIKKLGIPLAAKDISGLFGIALKHHEGKQQSYDEMVKAHMQYGKTSPAMVGAKATAQHYDVVNAIALAKEPRDVAAALLNEMKTKAEIGGIKQHGVLNEVQSKVLLAGIDNPRMKNHMTIFQANMKALGDQALRLTPEAYEKEKQKYIGDIMGTIKAFDFADKIKESFPAAIVPDQLGPGMSFNIGSKKYMVGADWSIKEVA